MVGHGGSSAGSYLADPTSPTPSHCASIVVTSTLRVNMKTNHANFHSISNHLQESYRSDTKSEKRVFFFFFHGAISINQGLNSHQGLWRLQTATVYNLELFKLSIKRHITHPTQPYLMYLWFLQCLVGRWIYVGSVGSQGLGPLSLALHQH